MMQIAEFAIFEKIFALKQQNFKSALLKQHHVLHVTLTAISYRGNPYMLNVLQHTHKIAINFCVFQTSKSRQIEANTTYHSVVPNFSIVKLGLLSSVDIKNPYLGTAS